MHKTSMIWGSLFCMTSILLGAFGAHYLKQIFTPELLVSFETGVRYQFYHGMALLFVGLVGPHLSRFKKTIVYLFITGTLLFSGSIYALCILKSQQQIGLSGLGILTPIGGILFIIGWGILCWSLMLSKPKEEQL